MLQPDLFFAYGMSSALAVAAGKKLQEEKSPWVNKYFLATMMWLSALYVPQVFYLLWRFPAWESMFVVKELADIPPWFILLYPMVVIGLGALGFQATLRLARREKWAAAIGQVGWSMGLAVVIVFVGWDGTGYQRLFYAGTGAEWAANVKYPLTAFFTSEVNQTLLWLECLVLAPFAFMLVKWSREGGFLRK